MAENDMPRINDLSTFFEHHGDQPIPSPELINQLGIPSHENFHKWRDAYRWNSAKYVKPNIDLDPAINEVHNVRLAQNDPLLLAFTDTATTARSDRPKQMKVGKYLNAFYKHKFTAEEIRDIATRHRAEFGPPTLKFTTSSDEVEHVYEHGPESCMMRKKGYLKAAEHSTRVYNTDSVCLAYLVKNNKITARTVINKTKKTWIRIYGDRIVMQKMLTDAGYTQGDLDGCTLLKIPAPDMDFNAFLMPYLDGECQRCTIRENDILVNHKGQVHGATTASIVLDDSMSAEPETLECSHCGDRYAEEDTAICRVDTPAGALNEILCDNCRGEHFLHTTDANARPAVVHNSDIHFRDGAGHYFASLASAQAAGFTTPYNRGTSQLISMDGARHSRLQAAYAPLDDPFLPINNGNDVYFPGSNQPLDNYDIMVNPYTDLHSRYSTRGYVDSLPAVLRSRHIPLSEYAERLLSAPNPEPSALSTHMNRGRRSNHSQWIYDDNDPLLHLAATREETSHAA